MGQTLTVHLPSELYVRIKKRADAACRSIEEEAVELLVANFPEDDALAAEFRQDLAALELLDDDALEEAARGRLAVELAEELESLHFRQQREGLTDAEDARRSELARAYERAMLVRASATAILKKRGIDVTQVARP